MSLNYDEQVLTISNKMMEVFIKNVLEKNNVNLQEAKKSLSNEKKKVLKETFLELKSQIEEYLQRMEEGNTLTEKDL